MESKALNNLSKLILESKALNNLSKLIFKVFICVKKMFTYLKVEKSIQSSISTS